MTEQKTKNQQLIKVTPVEETPFAYLEDEKHGNRIIIGNQIASEKTFKNFEEAKNYINEKPWELFTVLAGITAEKAIETKIINK